MIKTSFSSNQMLVLFASSFTNFFCSITVSILAPLYPAEAEKKGATATEYGLIIGCYSFMAFMTSPFLGKIIHKTGSKLMLGVGLMVSSAAVFAFGLLHLIESRFYFIFLSFVMIIVEGLGAAAATVAWFSMASCLFPDNLATVMSSLETFYGLGCIVGPTIAGILYELGGFPLTFFCVGILSGIVTILIFVYVPDVSELSQTESSTGNLFNAIRTPSIAIAAFCVVNCAVCQGFYAATLESHLRKFHISVLLVSLMFAITGVTYSVAVPFVGRLVDKCLKPKYALITSSILNIIGFSIVGPLPFLPIPQTMSVCVIALILQGLADAFGQIAGFVDGVQSAVAVGYPADISTYGLISGIWSSSTYFGFFVGPSIAGFLYDKVGFQNATIFVVIINVILLITLLNYLMAKKSYAEEEIVEKEELEKLL